MLWINSKDEWENNNKPENDEGRAGECAEWWWGDGELVERAVDQNWCQRLNKWVTKFTKQAETTRPLRWAPQMMDSTQCRCWKHCLSGDWKGVSHVTMEDTLWSWVSSWKTKTQNPTYTLSNKTDVLEMVVRDKGGVYSFFIWQVSTGLYIPDKYNLYYK